MKIVLKSLVPGLACLLLMLSSVTHAASRGISVEIKESESKGAATLETVELYADSYALVIGNDIYTNGWPSLSNAVKDAELVGEVLESKGFDVELHRNLDSDTLNTVLKRFFILKGDNPAARLFIWYAGHGATVDGEGYLIPTDAPIPSEGASFKYASIALRDFGTFMRQAVSKHAYAVFDSCFAGTVFSSQRAIAPAAITRATTQPVRQFLTSGDANQTVSDDGAFRELFIRAITGEERSDANGDGYVTASELGMFLGDRVTNLTESMQTPRYGKLRDKNFDRGDFVFTLPAGVEAAGRSLRGTGVANAEITFWNSIKNSENTNEYDAYLSQYPKGTFAALAMVKKTSIERKRKEAKAKAQAKEKFVVTFVDSDMEASKVANIRQTPFPTSTKVGRLGRGDRVWVVGQTQTQGGIWYKVARDGVALGFVYAPLLASTGRLDTSLLLSSEIPAANLDEQPEATDNTERSLQEIADDRFSSLVDGLLDEPATPDASTEVAGDVVGRTRVAPNSIEKNSPEPTNSPELKEGPEPKQASNTTTDRPLVVVLDDEKNDGQNYINQMFMTDISSSNQSQSDAPASNVETKSVATEFALGAEKSGTTNIGPDQDSDPGNSRSIEAKDLAEKRTEGELATPGVASEEIAPEPVQLALLTATKAQITATKAQKKRQSTSSNTDTDTDGPSEYIKRYIAVAEAGNAKAQLSLAYMYETGEQVKMNKATAVRWYERAADQGEIQAMLSLGVIYEAGNGIEVDLTESAGWFRKAALLGDADAQQSIGYMYQNGNGVVADPAEAVKWYLKAAEQGRVVAQNNLGRLYQLGIGVEKNLDQAIFWYEKAASQGSAAARKNLTELIPERY